MYDKESLTAATQQFNDRYAAGDEAWFNAFAEDAVIYSVDAAEPTKGLAAYRKHFGPHLKKKRKVQVLQNHTQLLGETAVVSQVVDIETDDVAHVVRETAIWKQTAGEWKVQHLNASVLLSGFAAGAAERGSGAVRVLKEKISVLASQQGVAQ